MKPTIAGNSSRFTEVNANIVIMLVIGMTTFAFAAVMVRAVGETDVFALASVRTVAAVLLLLPFWLRQRNRAESVFDRKDNFIAMLTGTVLGLHFLFWFLSLQYTSIASASVLVTIHPIIIILIEAGIFKRIFPVSIWAGVIVAFSGSVLLGYSDSQFESTFENALRGDLYAAFAAVLFALYFIISQRLRQKSDWINYVFRVYSATAVTCLAAAIMYGSKFPTEPVVWIVGIGLAIGPQIIGHGSLNYAVKFVSPTMLSMLILAEPALATILAWLIFAEIPPSLTVVAMVVVLAGIVIAWSAKIRK